MTDSIYRIRLYFTFIYCPGIRRKNEAGRENRAGAGVRTSPSGIVGMSAYSISAIQIT